jgi:hypothetical protein
MYGTADIKKMDTRSIPFDFSLIKQMTTPEFLDNFQTELESFLDALHAEQSEGKIIF